MFPPRHVQVNRFAYLMPVCDDAILCLSKLTGRVRDGILFKVAGVAQLVEHEIRNFGVISSSLITGSTSRSFIHLLSLQTPSKPVLALA